MNLKGVGLRGYFLVTSCQNWVSFLFEGLGFCRNSRLGTKSTLFLKCCDIQGYIPPGVVATHSL